MLVYAQHVALKGLVPREAAVPHFCCPCPCLPRLCPPTPHPSLRLQNGRLASRASRARPSCASHGCCPPPALPCRALAICELPGLNTVVEAVVEDLQGPSPHVVSWKQVGTASKQRPRGCCVLQHGWGNLCDEIHCSAGGGGVMHAAAQRMPVHTGHGVAAAAIKQAAHGVSCKC